MESSYKTTHSSLHRFQRTCPESELRERIDYKVVYYRFESRAAEDSVPLSKQGWTERGDNYCVTTNYRLRFSCEGGGFGGGLVVVF